MAHIEKWRGTKSQHEKCKIIAAEIYKRINITFAIKKANTYQSDSSLNSTVNSDDLSETDLFAYDSGVSSSCDENTYGRSLLLNNNEEKSKFKRHSIARPLKIRKKYRKRAKKRNFLKKRDDGSSDDGLPLKKMAAKAENSGNPKECSKVANLTDEIEKLNPSGPELQNIEKFNNVSRYGTNAPACFAAKDSTVSKSENNSLSLLQKFVKSDWNSDYLFNDDNVPAPAEAPQPEKVYSCPRNGYPIMTAARKRYRYADAKEVPNSEKTFQSSKLFDLANIEQAPKNYKDSIEFESRALHPRILATNANRRKSVIVSRKRQGPPIDHEFNGSAPQTKMMRDSSTETRDLPITHI